MKQIKILLQVCVFSFILLAGCKKEIGDNEIGTRKKSENKSNTLADPTQATNLSFAEGKVKLDLMLSAIPQHHPEKLKNKAALLLREHPQYQHLIQRAFSSAPGECDQNTAFFQWYIQQLADWNDDVIYYAIETGMDILPSADALVFENISDNQYFGINGEYSKIITKTFTDVKRFWNIQSGNIALVAMHGAMLRNRDKLIRAYTIIFGLSPEDASFYADLVLLLIEVIPQYRNGDHPAFTFNGYARPAIIYSPELGMTPEKIVIGDGFLDGCTAIGFGDVAPQAILAHEFGHHIQFQLLPGLDIFGDFTPEETRRIELMADAFSAYFLSHARGASMQWKRVKQFLETFYNFGDCYFNSTSHHGTPAQRMAAAEWAYNLVTNTVVKGHILSAEAFIEMFDADLTEILAH